MKTEKRTTRDKYYDLMVEMSQKPFNIKAVLSKYNAGAPVAEALKKRGMIEKSHTKGKMFFHKWVGRMPDFDLVDIIHADANNGSTKVVYRGEHSSHIRLKKIKTKKETVVNSTPICREANDNGKVEWAIQLLKSKGYKVMKAETKFIEV